MTESQHTEWKAIWKDDYLKWTCAFANTEGGTLHIGRDDSGNVIGLEKPKKLLEDLPNKTRDALGILIDVYLRRQSGKSYLEIVVEPLPNPISYRGHYYRRSCSTVQEYKGTALDRFLLRRHGRTWDSVPIPGLHIRNLSTQALQRFRQLAIESGRLASQVSEDSDANLIERLNLTEGTYLKRAAALLFHNNPESFVAGAYIKIGYFRDESDLVYHDELHGNLFAQVARSIDLLQTKYLKAAISYKGLQRIERFPVPGDALREVMLNALVHRDYAIAAPVQVRVYENRLRIWNPAELPEGWSVKTLLGEHPSIPYNPAIANAFFRSGEIETWGRGIQRIFAACKKAGTPQPQISLQGNDLWFEFPFSKTYLQEVSPKLSPKSGNKTSVRTLVKSDTRTSANRVTTTSEHILQMLKKNPNLTLSQIAEALAQIHTSNRNVELQSGQKRQAPLRRPPARRSLRSTIKISLQPKLQPPSRAGNPSRRDNREHRSRSGEFPNSRCHPP